MKRKIVWMVAAVLLVAGAWALGEKPLVDRAGNTIKPPEKAERVVSLAPSMTQVIIDLGLADTLVGVDTYTATSKEVPAGLAAFDMMTPDIERIIALSPDVVLVSGLMLVDGENVMAQLGQLGICVAYVPTSGSIEGILEDTLFIGSLLGEEEKAAALNQALVDTIDALRAPTDAPVSVYFEVDPSLYSFGTGTFLDEMITLLGGRNIFHDQEGWLALSEESIVAAAPEIIFTNYFEQGAELEILARKGWETVPAVANGRVYPIDTDTSAQPNHRIAKALLQMADAMREATSAIQE